MEPVSLLARALSEHDIALGQLFGRHDAHELVALEVVDDQIFRPRKTRACGEQRGRLVSCEPFEHLREVLDVVGREIIEPFGYRTGAANLIADVSDQVFRNGL